MKFTFHLYSCQLELLSVLVFAQTSRTVCQIHLFLYHWHDYNRERKGQEIRLSKPLWQIRNGYLKVEVKKSSKALLLAIPSQFFQLVWNKSFPHLAFAFDFYFFFQCAVMANNHSLKAALNLHLLRPLAFGNV